MKNTCDFSVVIVNWKVSELVKELLASIAEETRDIDYEIFVVDNASGDGIGEVTAQFAEAHPDIPLQFIQNGENLGFAAANNIAIRRARGRQIVLLNPDTRIKDGALQKMVVWMDAHPNVGIAGPKLTELDGSAQPSVRRFPGLIDQVMILLKLHRLWPGAPPLKRYLAAGFDYSKEADVDQVMGAALFVRREVLEQTRLMDEDFFIWFEEVDLCRRAKTAGFRVVYTPCAEIVHYGGASFAQAMTLAKQKLFSASMRIYFKKHHGSLASAVLILPQWIGFGLAALYSIWEKKR